MSEEMTDLDQATRKLYGQIRTSFDRYLPALKVLDPPFGAEVERLFEEVNRVLLTRATTAEQKTFWPADYDRPSDPWKPHPRRSKRLAKVTDESSFYDKVESGYYVEKLKAQWLKKALDATDEK
jgi:hypothetical protein